MKRRITVLLVAILLFLSACGGGLGDESPESTPTVSTEPTEAAPPTEEAAEEEEPTVEVTAVPPEEEATEAAVATQTAPAVATTEPTALIPTPTPFTFPTIEATPTPLIEERVAEVEWPRRMRLGNSDTVRLAVIPNEEGLTITTEFPEHAVVTSTLTLEQPAGYDLALGAELDGIGFSLSPVGDQRQDWQPEEPMYWHWTIRPDSSGQHRLSLTLTLHRLPQAGNPNTARQSTIYSKGLDVQVSTFMGMTTRMVMVTGFLGLLLGAALNVPLIRYLRSGSPKTAEKEAQRRLPNEQLAIEPHPDIHLNEDEIGLLQALFNQYDRLTLEVEFRSGYSGARTLLALPIQADGRSDAYTIAKLGEKRAIQKEYDNYKTYVENTLPPVTARIQDRPVVVDGRVKAPGTAAGDGRLGENGRRGESGRLKVRLVELAALRYTFIGEPGQRPISLRQSLLEKSEPALLEKLFRTFGPNWWMQRRPYTFRLLQEYDCKLPSHYIIEPAAKGRGQEFDGIGSPADYDWQPGDLVALTNFKVVEMKGGGQRLSLEGARQAGQAPLRLRWLGTAAPEGAVGRVVATRDSLLRGWTADFDLLRLPDPLAVLPERMQEQVGGTQSPIHGDLNLENILVGPGGFVWLIDFASTRDGHPLFDFAHLAAEIVAHTLTPQIETAEEYLALLREGGGPLLMTLEKIAGQCLFNPDNRREYHLALYISCLGALKYGNLDKKAKYRLYLTAAYLAAGG